MTGIIKPLFFEPARHLYKMFNDREYLNYSILGSRLGGIPRFIECAAKVHGWEISIPDSASFLSAYKEIFVEKIYALKCEDRSPKILDLGANIGLSVLFFKFLYPEAEITAFEADPKIFGYLKRNVHGNGFTNVELVNKAAWNKDAMLKFNSEGADGGRATLAEDSNIIEVEAIDMARYLNGKKFDFIKMDIEGAEEFVLPSCKEYLNEVSYLFVEYHSKKERKQSLNGIINVMANAGFRLHIQSIMPSPSPFIERRTNSGFDLQLNIFGFRDAG